MTPCRCFIFLSEYEQILIHKKVFKNLIFVRVRTNARNSGQENKIDISALPLHTSELQGSFLKSKHITEHVSVYY